MGRRFLDAKNEGYFMKSTLRILLGFLLAPLITPFTFLAAISFREGMVAFRVLPALTWVGFFAYGAALILGGPAFLLYWMLRLTNPIWFLIGGGLIGFIVVLMLDLWLGGGSVRDAVTPIVAASLSALIFRLIIGRQDSERSVIDPKQIN